MASFDPTTHVVTGFITATNVSNGLVTLATGITQAQLDSADLMMITPQADLWYLPGSTTVTASLFHILSVNKTYTFSGIQVIRNLRFLRAGSVNVVATVSLFKVNRDNVHI